jgi:hypothetical protein
VKWLDLHGAVDYPPLAILELAVVGRLYQAIDPAYGDSTLLTLLVKTPGLIAEIVFVALLLTWGRRLIGDRAATWAALAFWLSPAIWFTGSALGYVDAQGAVPATLAVVAAAANLPAVAGALAAVAVGTKPQTVFLVPIAAALLVGRASPRRWRALAVAAASGAIASALIVAPFVLRGATANMILGVSRLLHHDMLSGAAPNLGWIATWILRVWYAVPDMGWAGALGLEIRILQISRVIELGYPDPRPLATVCIVAATALAAWRTFRQPSLTVAAACGAWAVYAYTMFGIPVHENHFYPAIPLLALAAALHVPLRPVFWTTSAIFVVNLYVFYGLSRGWPSAIDRGWTFVDLSVLIALANVAAFVWATKRIWRMSGVEDAERTARA